MMRGLVFGGVDTFVDLGLLLKSKTLNPPVVKRSTIDVPGGNGLIDLTRSLSGDTPYGNRTDTFVFTARCRGDEFEQLKTHVSNLLHGCELEYSLPWDEGYTYTGWFEVSGSEAAGSIGTLTVTVDTDPYKLKPTKTMRIQAGGGTTVLLPSGRMRVSPVFECNRPFVVACNGVSAALPAGASKVRGLYLHEGLNVLYANSASSGGVATWADMPATWRALSNKFWGDLQWMVGDKPTGPEYDIYATYDWGDL